MLIQSKKDKERFEEVSLKDWDLMQLHGFSKHWKVVDEIATKTEKIESVSESVADFIEKKKKRITKTK